MCSHCVAGVVDLAVEHEVHLGQLVLGAEAQLRDRAARCCSARRGSAPSSVACAQRVIVFSSESVTCRAGLDEARPADRARPGPPRPARPRSAHHGYEQRAPPSTAFVIRARVSIVPLCPGSPLPMILVVDASDRLRHTRGFGRGRCPLIRPWPAPRARRTARRLLPRHRCARELGDVPALGDAAPRRSRGPSRASVSCSRSISNAAGVAAAVARVADRELAHERQQRVVVGEARRRGVEVLAQVLRGAARERAREVGVEVELGERGRAERRQRDAQREERALRRLAPRRSRPPARPPRGPARSRGPGAVPPPPRGRRCSSSSGDMSSRSAAIRRSSSRSALGPIGASTRAELVDDAVAALGVGEVAGLERAQDAEADERRPTPRPARGSRRRPCA